MIAIRNKIPVVLVLLTILIAVYSRMSFKEEIAIKETPKKANIGIEDIEINIEFGDEEIIELEDANMYQTEYETRNLEILSKFLDPFEVDRYNSLLVLYAMYIPEVINSSNDIWEFYDHNEKAIGDYLGVYGVDDFKLFYEYISDLNITGKSGFEDISIVDVGVEGNLLRSRLKIDYGTDILDIEHYISYVYIEGISNLFIYHYY